MAKSNYDAARFKRSGRGKIYDSIVDLVGDTPLVRLPHLTAALKPKGEVLAKLEFFNPLASVKDRIGASMIEWMEAEGILEPGGLIVEPTYTFPIAGKNVKMANGHDMKFTPDFAYIENGRKIVEDVKAANAHMARDVPVKLALARHLWPDVTWRVVA